MPGGRAHLPDIELDCRKMIEFGLHLFLYPFLQVPDLLTRTNLNREVPVGCVENPTPEFELVI